MLLHPQTHISHSSSSDHQRKRNPFLKIPTFPKTQIGKNLKTYISHGFHFFFFTSRRISLPYSQDLPFLQLHPSRCRFELHLSHSLSPSNPFKLRIPTHPPPRNHHRRRCLRLRRRFLREKPVVRCSHGCHCAHSYIPRLCLCSHFHQHFEVPRESQVVCA